MFSSHLHLFFQADSKEVPETFKTIQSIIIVLDYPPNYMGRLLLKTPYNWTTGHREIDLEPTVNFLPAGRQVVTVQEGAVEASGREKGINCLTQSWTLFATAAACQARCAQLCNNGMTVVGVTNHFLIAYEACSTERAHAWYYKPDQKPMAREITEHKGEPASVILLIGHVFKESPTYICLHPQTWAVLSLGQRGFFCAVSSSQQRDT